MTGWTEADVAAIRNRTPGWEGRTLGRSGKSYGSHKSGVMNKYEQRYSDLLELRRIAGDIHSWWFEKVKLKLAKATHYTPDFLVQLGMNNVLEIHEVKGFWRDDARAKIKIAAEMFHCFRFVAVTWEGGEWKEERF